MLVESGRQTLAAELRTWCKCNCLDWNHDNHDDNNDDNHDDNDDDNDYDNDDYNNDDNDDDEPCHKLLDPWQIVQTAGNQKPRSYDNGWGGIKFGPNAK